MGPSFLHQALDVGLRTWDLAPKYQMFGEHLQDLCLSSLGIFRSQIQLNYKVGAARTEEGFCKFDLATWEFELNTVLSKPGIDHLDCLMIWGLPDPKHTHDSIGWLRQKQASGACRKIGFANISQLQFELIRHVLKDKTGRLDTEKLAVQIRCSPVLASELAVAKGFASTGIEVQAYGMFHSGLLLNPTGTARSEYSEEFLVHRGDIQTYIGSLEKDEIIAKVLFDTRQTGAQTIILFPSTIESLRQIQAAL